MSPVPDLPPYSRPPATKEKLDYVQLASLDLSKFDRPGGKTELVNDLRNAIENVGFLFVTGHGIEDDEVVRQLQIGNAFFKLPLEEKRQHPCDFDQGKYWGFREPKETYDSDRSVKSKIEMLNHPKDTAVLADDQLRFQFLEPFKPEISAFSKKVHARILDPLLRLFSLLLELPEEYLADPHAYDKASDDHLRYMIYGVHSAAEAAKIGNQTVRGHTDFGLLTILFPQIVNALQVQTAPGEYSWVPYIPGHVVVNTAEVLTFISGGVIKSTVHRVVRPPEDQANYERLGLLYFSRPANDFPVTIAPSPLLERLGIYDPAKADPNPPKGLEWGRARVKHTHLRKVIEHTDKVEPFKFAGHEINLEYVSPPLQPKQSTPLVAATA
ncbi:Putative flavonol synthase [Rhodotorula kratochvilovae]